MRKNAFTLLFLSGLAVCGLSSLVFQNTSTSVDIRESTVDNYNEVPTRSIKKAQDTTSTEVKVSKTFVQLGQKDDLLLLRYATAVSGPIKSAYYTRTCEGLGTKKFEIDTIYQGIKSGEDIYYYDEVEGKPTTSVDYQGDYYWACYVVAYETNTYAGANFNLELTVIADDGSEVVAESKTQNLHNAIGYVDLNDDLSAKYNIKISTSDILPKEGGISKQLTCVSGSGRIYAGVGAIFEKGTDLQNKKIEMDIKLLENVYKSRFTFELINGSTKTSQEPIYFNEDFLIKGKYDNKTFNSEKYSVDIREDGWYHVTLFVPKAFALDSYVVEYLNIGFANDDSTKDATCLIANVNMSNYDLFSYTDIPDAEEPTYYDYSDDLQRNYASTISIDKTVSHDGTQSAKFVGNKEELASPGYNCGAQTHIQKSLAGKKLSFYIKYDGNTCYNNRVSITFYSNSTTKINSDPINVSFKDKLLNGITLSSADNGWNYVELDIDALGYNATEVYKVRFVIQSNDDGVTAPTCWIDQINIK